VIRAHIERPHIPWRYEAAFIAEREGVSDVTKEARVAGTTKESTLGTYPLEASGLRDFREGHEGEILSELLLAVDCETTCTLEAETEGAHRRQAGLLCAIWLRVSAAGRFETAACLPTLFHHRRAAP
jgi:hypothetical protein